MESASLIPTRNASLCRAGGNHKGYELYLAREIFSITQLTMKETGTSGKGARFEISVPKGMYRGSDSGENRSRKTGDLISQ